jgi:hypothetical protein
MEDGVENARVEIEYFYPYSSILYNIIHSMPSIRYYTLSYILSLLFHTVHYFTFFLHKIVYSIDW